MNYRSLAGLSISFLLVATCPAHAKANPASPKSDVENDVAVRKLYEQFTAAWNRHDTNAMANMWVEDGDHVEPDGRVAKGRREIEAALKLQHGGIFKNTQLKLTLDSVWFITGDVALVDGTYELSGASDPGGKDIGTRIGRLTSVFLKEGGRWWIAASRLMIPSALPYREKK